MSDTDNTLPPGGRRPGPWDARPEEAAPAPAREAPRYSARHQAPQEDKGQHPVWAVVSTLLMAGFLWFLTGSGVVAGAVLFGLFVHEYGHVLAMNRVGMGPARIYIIPFLGGLAKGQREPKSEWHGVLVSLAGPAFGLLAMIPFVAAGLVLREADWLRGAFFIAMINLLNLLPAPPLDGSKALGPVLTRVHPRLEQVVLLLIGGLAVWWGVSTGRFILAVFLGLAVFGHLKRGVWRAAWGRLSWPEAGRSLALYLLTAVVCAAAAIGALLPLTGGAVEPAFEMGLRFFGLGGR
ncbi:metalloprotease [Brevundimonas diminuta]|jgi:Zn-dependent protease|uniref:metalloprotease n=1 Tax=Brevundimonas diminuta TaxID=293 RepID=UPI0035DFB445